MSNVNIIIVAVVLGVASIILVAALTWWRRKYHPKAPSKNALALDQTNAIKNTAKRYLQAQGQRNISIRSTKILEAKSPRARHKSYYLFFTYEKLPTQQLVEEIILVHFKFRRRRLGKSAAAPQETLEAVHENRAALIAQIKAL